MVRAVGGPKCLHFVIVGCPSFFLRSSLLMSRPCPSPAPRCAPFLRLPHHAMLRQCVRVHAVTPCRVYGSVYCGDCAQRGHGSARSCLGSVNSARLILGWWPMRPLPTGSEAQPRGAGAMLRCATLRRHAASAEPESWALRPRNEEAPDDVVALAAAAPPEVHRALLGAAPLGAMPEAAEEQPDDVEGPREGNAALQQLPFPAVRGQPPPCG